MFAEFRISDANGILGSACNCHNKSQSTFDATTHALLNLACLETRFCKPDQIPAGVTL
jgi:hypothetical protein